MLAFIHIEKTAGATIDHILRSSYGIRHCEVRPLGKQKDVFKPFSPADLRLTVRLHPAGLRSIAGHSVTPYMGLEQVRPLRYFTFLREPLKQCASYYQYLVDRHGKRMDFGRWIAQDWPRNMQCRRLAGVADADAAIQVIAEKEILVGLVEQFDDSLILLKALQAPNLNLCFTRPAISRPANPWPRSFWTTPARWRCSPRPQTKTRSCITTPLKRSFRASRRKPLAGSVMTTSKGGKTSSIKRSIGSIAI